MRLHYALCTFLCVLVTSSSGVAEEWGTLTGQFIWPDDAPKREKLELNKDLEFCGPKNLLDESLVVDDESGGLKNVVIYLYERDAVPTHPDFAKTAEEKVVLKNEDCRFEPHILLMRPTQTLQIENKDPIAHATAILFLSNDPFSVSTPGNGAPETRTLTKEERLPAPVTCPIHSWMKGYLLVRESPYMAVTDEKGRFTIPNLPVGTWTFRVWHELPGYVKSLKGNDAVTLERGGRLKLTIKAGKNDLGELSVDPDDFE